MRLNWATFLNSLQIVAVLFSCSVGSDELAGKSECELRLAGAPLVLGNLVIDEDNVYWRGKVVQMKVRARFSWEYDRRGDMKRILLGLAGSAGRFVSTRELLGLLGPQVPMEPDRQRKFIKSMVWRIRCAFLSVDPEFKQIQSSYGRGYLWVPDFDQDHRIPIGDLEIDTHRQIAFWRSEILSLSKGQFTLLKLLALNGDRSFSSIRLYSVLDEVGALKRVRLDSQLKRRTVKLAMSRLIEAFRSVDPTFSRIELTTFGYRWRSGATQAMEESSEQN